MSNFCREGYKFREDIRIPCYQTDRSAQLRPAAFMEMAQEIAFRAAGELGFGYDNLHEHHMAWVLSRMHIRFDRPVKWRDDVTLYTWHKGSDGLFYLRDFELLKEDTAIVATSSWVVIDDRTRRLIRPEDFTALTNTENVADAIKDPAPKLIPPRDKELRKAGEHTVAYSDVDIYGHTNNARYVVWAMDVLPLEQPTQPAQPEQKPLKDLFINFNRETLPGETVELYCLETEPGTFFIEGRTAGKACFTAKLQF